jgi:hypothetical protein
VFAGIRIRVGDAVRVEYARGVPVVQRQTPSLFDPFGWNTPSDPEGFDEDAEFQRAVDLAAGADVAAAAHALICRPPCQVGRVKRCPGAAGGGGRVGDRRVVSLICAGWLPQDGLFGW